MNNENRIPDYDFSKLSASFKGLLGSPEMIFQLLDMFTQPIQVFDPDGTTIFLNRALLNMLGIVDADMGVGKFNILHDPVSDEIFGHEIIERAFRGEVVSVSEFSAPIQDLVNRGLTKEKPFETAYMDTSLLPIFNGDKLAYVINTFNINRVYKGIPEVAAAKEYIDSHWLDKFDAYAVARAVNVSYSSLAHLFKQHEGMTLQAYYQQVKVDHIKEKLADKNLTVAEAFSFCGEDSRGSFAKTFREMTGMTPKEYRNSLQYPEVNPDE